MAEAEAEAEAIRAGLVVCVDKGFDVVHVESDSKELVDMISGITQPNIAIEGFFFYIYIVKVYKCN